MRFMDSEVNVRTLPDNIPGCGTFIELSGRYVGDVKNDGLSAGDLQNRIIAQLKLDSLLKNCAMDEKTISATKNDFWFYGGGWQSWGFGGEVEPGKNQKKYFPLIPQWKNYINFPGKAPSRIGERSSSSKSILRGQFLIYLRWENTYLALASTGALNDDGVLPPVQFFVDRKKRTVTVSVYSEGKRWEKMELMGKFVVFSANNFFALKDGIKFIFGDSSSSRFDYLKFLSKNGEQIKCAGWESWYNHYSDINQNLISEDLISLGKNDNIINALYSKNDLPVVFQVDDGWEKNLGDWNANLDRFPDGMKKLAESISEKNYVPGLWIAPFIIDLRSEIAKNHPEWILRKTNGKPVAAGMNPLWGAKFGKNQPSYPCSYFCLDLSRDEVIEYLDNLMEKIINDWGFRYIKLDFLFAGMLSGKFANGSSAYVWYDRAIKKLTRRLINNSGERIAYLGCGLPFESSFMTMPLSRIGPDTKEVWDVNYLRRVNFSARTGAKPNLQSTLGHSFWDQSIFINDPDVIFLRYTNIKLDDGEKEMIAVVNKLFASQIMHSDDPTDFSMDEADFTQHVISLYEKLDGEEFGFVNLKGDVYLIFSKNGKYCGIINLSEKPFNLRKSNFIQQVNFVTENNFNDDSAELIPVIDNCVNAGDLYTAEKHTLSIFEIVEGASEDILDAVDI